MAQGQFVPECSQREPNDACRPRVQRPPRGLGSDVKTIGKLCHDRPDVESAIERVTQRKPGNPTGENQYQSGTVDNINNSSRPNGTSKQAALRRLRKDAPEMLERVLAGEISAHAAMVEAGFRKRRQGSRHKVCPVESPSPDGGGTCAFSRFAGTDGGTVAIPKSGEDFS